MSREQIEKMYEDQYNSQKVQYDNNKKDQYNSLNNDYLKGKDKFYNDRNSAASQNARDVQRVRDMMANSNLSHSGESVDGMLRVNTDFANAKGRIYGDENEFNRGIADKRRLVDSEYANNLQGLRSRIDSEKAQQVMAWEMEQQKLALEREKMAMQERIAQQQAAARSSASRSSSQQNMSKADFKANFRSNLDTERGRVEMNSLLNSSKNEIVGAYGLAYYQELKDEFDKTNSGVYGPTLVPRKNTPKPTKSNSSNMFNTNPYMNGGR